MLFRSQNKCINKMRSVANSGRTILFVSHDEKAVNKLCNRGVYMKQGKVIALGSASEMLDLYGKEKDLSQVA